MDRIHFHAVTDQQASVSTVLLAATNLSVTPRTLISNPAPAAGLQARRIMIQKITVHITTDAAQSLTLQDSAGTPVIAFTVPASPGLGATKTVDYGTEGFALTESKDLVLVNSAAGLAASIAVQAYSTYSSPTAP